MDLWKYVLVKYVGRFSAYSIYSFSAEACKRKYSFIAMLLCFFNGSLYIRAIGQKREGKRLSLCRLFNHHCTPDITERIQAGEERGINMQHHPDKQKGRSIAQSHPMSINQSIINCTKSSKSQKYYQSSWKESSLKKKQRHPTTFFVSKSEQIIHSQAEVKSK